MIAVGTSVEYLPYFMVNERDTPEERLSNRIVGKVISVNNAHRFFTVQYMAHGVPIRESFKFSQLGEEVVICG
jgi:hypothetical protein